MERYDESEIDPAFRVVVSHWLTKIESAKRHKKKVFQESADECQAFYDGPKSWDDMMDLDGGLENVDLAFKVKVNKAFEFVTIFGPAMYSENPVRTVKPRMPVVVPGQFFGPDQMLYQALLQQESLRVQADGLRSVLIQTYLNWTPVEFRLGTEARAAINEALVKGRGCAWTELYSPPGSEMTVARTVFDTVDNLLVDPDAPSFDKALWVARRCIHPVWKVEKDYGLRPGSIRGNMESMAAQAEVDADDDRQYDRKRGLTNDLLVYYKIFSRMGIGGRLGGIKRELREPLEMFGDHAYIVVADGVQFPLNLPPDATNAPGSGEDTAGIFSRVAWPTPFWGSDEYPVSPLDFHEIPNSPWPLPHLKAGLGELKFLNWAMSFLMGKIRNTSRDFIAVKKEAGEEIKTLILEGRDLTLLEIEAAHGTIQELISFLQHPEVNGDIWKMIAAVEENFDKRIGLTELMYGNQGATQIRSAQEAALRNQNMNVRPDDMRKQVEAWMSRIAAKEAVAARYHLTANDVLPAVGQMGAMMWGQFVSTRDINVACRQLEYRIEAGSTARPNKQVQVQNATEALQVLSPIFQAYGQMTGDLMPMNNLLADFAESRDLDPSRYQLRAPMMMPAAPAPAEGAPAEGGEGAPPPAQ